MSPATPETSEAFFRGYAPEGLSADQNARLEHLNLFRALRILGWDKHLQSQIDLRTVKDKTRWKLFTDKAQAVLAQYM